MALLPFNSNPSPRQLRWFGGVWLPLGLGYLAHATRSPPARVALLALGALSLAVGLVAPRLVRPVFVGLLVLSRPVQFVVSHVILAALFWGVITPTAWILRAAGRDGLNRGLARDATSYWIKRPARPPLSGYFRQF